jgi:hypothetical protein
MTLKAPLLRSGVPQFMRLSINDKGNLHGCS